MSNVVLSVHRGAEPVSWTEFCETHPRYSIALDGYVSGMSRYDGRGPWLTLDHHADVDRLSARATCSQVLLCIRQGLFGAFGDEHGPRATVYANDGDEDACMSWFLLHNPQVSYSPSHTRLNRLVQAVDLLDTTAGASLHPLDRTLMSELAWVFEPYRKARMPGALDLPRGDLPEQIIATVSNRIREHLMDKGGIIGLDTRFERIGGGNGWQWSAKLEPKHVRAWLKLGFARTFPFARGPTAPGPMQSDGSRRSFPSMCSQSCEN